MVDALPSPCYEAFKNNAHCFTLVQQSVFVPTSIMDSEKIQKLCFDQIKEIEQNLIQQIKRENRHVQFCSDRRLDILTKQISGPKCPRKSVTMFSPRCARWEPSMAWKNIPTPEEYFIRPRRMHAQYTKIEEWKMVVAQSLHSGRQGRSRVLHKDERVEKNDSAYD